MVPSRRINQNWLPSMFNDFFDNDWMERSNATAPAINVLENENSYDLELAAPGMTKQDFQVRLDDNGDLVIDMEKKEEENEKKTARSLSPSRILIHQVPTDYVAS
jgi:HSP20 family protein